MKIKIPFILLILVAISLFAFYHNKEKRGENIKNEAKEKTSIQESTYYGLWKQESDNQTLNPKNLDGILDMQNESIKRYKNYYFGYRLNFPSEWEVDRHQVPHFTRFYHEDFRLDITFQNVKEAYTTIDGFYEKTLSSIRPYIVSEKQWENNGYKIKSVEYKRPKIKNIQQDLNYYTYFFLEKENEIITFQLKTKENTTDDFKEKVLNVIDSVRNIEKKDVDLNELAKKTNLNPEINIEYKKTKLNIEQNEFMMGIFSANTTDSEMEIKEIEKELDGDIGVHMIYKWINSNFDEHVNVSLRNQRLPVVTILFETADAELNKTVVKDIIEGKYDEFLLSWTKGVRKSKGPVFFRLGNEMNGDWASWSHKNNYNDYDLYKLAFQRIVQKFEEGKVKNAYFVWNPNNRSSPYFNWNHEVMYYPGDDYVDWIGLTAYNFGENEWGKFKMFDEIYEEFYYDDLRLYANKPMMIGEFGSVEKGGSKAAFIQEMFELIPQKYTNIKMAIWFNRRHDEYDFQIHTSEESQKAFSEGLRSEKVVNSLEKK